MKVHKNLWAGYPTWFIPIRDSGPNVVGIKLMNINGEWLVNYNTKFPASDIRHDTEHFPVVGDIDMKNLLINSIIQLGGENN